MKKVFALVVLAGSLSFFACENNSTETHEGEGQDTTTVIETPAPTTTDTAATTTDTAGNTGGTTGADTTMKK